MTMREELDVEAFLRAARAPALDPDAGKDAVRASLLSTLGPASFVGRSLSRPASSSSTFRLRKARFGWKSPLLVVSGFALGVAAHAALGAWVGRPIPSAGLVLPSVTASPPIVAPIERAPTRAPTRDGVVDVESLPTASSSAKGGAPKTPPRERDDLSAERVMLETARTAIERSDIPHALEALERHEKRFPHGQLREERESLRIGALMMAGREAEARAKTAEFHRSFPDSLQGAALDALVGGGP